MRGTIFRRELPGPPENGNHGRSHGALTGQRLLYFPDFPISRETVVGYEHQEQGEEVRCEIARRERYREARERERERPMNNRQQAAYMAFAA